MGQREIDCNVLIPPRGIYFFLLELDENRLMTLVFDDGNVRRNVDAHLEPAILSGRGASGVYHYATI
jgi:hypothetical protein